MDGKHNHFQSESKLNSSEIKQDGKGGKVPQLPQSGSQSIEKSSFFNCFSK